MEPIRFIAVTFVGLIIFGHATLTLAVDNRIERACIAKSEMYREIAEYRDKGASLTDTLLSFQNKNDKNKPDKRVIELIRSIVYDVYRNTTINPLDLARMKNIECQRELDEKAKQNSRYKTKAFNDPNGRVSTLYKCIVVSQKHGFAEDAIYVIARAFKGLAAQESGELLDDALTWYDSVKDNYPFGEFWKSFCEQPLERMRRLYE